jgi:menaquinone-dependent protoporphyrinogen oxidase
VLGSAVYVGRWLEPARELVEAHADALTERPTWLFSSGPLGDPPKPEADDAVQIGEIAERVNARDHRLFAGRLDRKLLGFGERAVVLAFRAPEGDFRDWDEIAAWAREIAASLEA